MDYSDCAAGKDIQNLMNIAGIKEQSRTIYKRNIKRILLGFGLYYAIQILFSLLWPPQEGYSVLNTVAVNAAETVSYCIVLYLCACALKEKSLRLDFQAVLAVSFLYFSLNCGLDLLLPESANALIELLAIVTEIILQTAYIILLYSVFVKGRTGAKGILEDIRYQFGKRTLSLFLYHLSFFAWILLSILPEVMMDHISTSSSPIGKGLTLILTYGIHLLYFPAVQIGKLIILEDTDREIPVN